LDNAASQQIRKITDNMNRIKMQADNLRANLELLKPNWCILGGTWSGQCVNDQFSFIKAPASLVLTNNAVQGGTFTYGGQAMDTKTVAISNKTTLTLTFGIPSIAARTLQGNFDSQYRSFQGKMTIPGSPGLTSSCQMSGSGH
jgi:hypothetical protein